MDNKHEQKLQAVLLADSFTKTFRPISLDQPKVLCPLNNVTMLDYSLEFLAGAGVEEVFCVCVHGAQEVEEHVRKQLGGNGTGRSMKVTVVKDESCTNAGDALRELDKRNLVRSDPFILLSGDVVTNVDIVPALQAHKDRHKKDASSIMTMLFKRVGSQSSPLRSVQDDLVLGMDPHQHNRILLYDNHANNAHHAQLPCSFFQRHAQVQVRTDLLDVGIDICSPEVLARFSDEFDYRDIRRQFVANSVAEEEEGLQVKLHGHLLGASEYAARIHDMRTYHAVSRDLLRRWCYPIVPDNLPSGYEKVYRYVMGRHFCYKECKEGGTKIGRDSLIQGPTMIGSMCWIGKQCQISGTVMGNHCHVADGAVVKDSHLWEHVTIQEGASVTQSILCQDVVIHAGAVVSKGCVIGKGCIIGANVVLPEFTRITLMSADLDGDDQGADAFSDSDDEESSTEWSEEEGENDSGEGGIAGSKVSERSGAAVVTDYDVVGKDGAGRVWIPPPSTEDGDDDSNYDTDNEDNEEGALQAALELVKSQSIGFDPTPLYRKRMKQLEEGNAEDDFFSDDENSDDDMDMGSDGSGFDDMYPGGGDSGMMFGDAGGGAGSMDVEMITGRQRGVDVVKELKSLCLDHEKTSPIENLAIELNSFKFSQNATYSDCVTGAFLAILESMGIEESTTNGDLVTGLKVELEHWGPLFQKICHGMEEEKSLITALETAALGSGVIGDVLSRQPAFRFLLQTLHDQEIVGEEAISSWAAERKAGDLNGNPRGTLFLQQPTQDFLEWLEEESESDDEDDEESEDEED